MNCLRTIMLVLAVALAAHGCTKPGDVISEKPAAPVKLTGDYLGQTAPGIEPELFAPGIVSTGLYERDIAMTPDGSELYFGIISGGTVTIAMVKRRNNEWSAPEIAQAFSDPDIFDLEPHITPDGGRFLFLSTRPKEGQEKSQGWQYQDIWAMDRTGDGWGTPYNLGPPVCTDAAEYFPSVTKDGTLYFTRTLTDGGQRRSMIFRSRLIDGAYAEPEMLPPEINPGDNQFNAFVDPDERYVIVPIAGHPDNIGRSDYYVTFRNDDDTWIGPINMGERINTPGNNVASPYVSPDGRYFFFASNRTDQNAEKSALTYDVIQQMAFKPQNGSADIYWVDASFIESLRPVSTERQE